MISWFLFCTIISALTGQGAAWRGGPGAEVLQQAEEEEELCAGGSRRGAPALQVSLLMVCVLLHYYTQATGEGLPQPLPRHRPGEAQAGCGGTRHRLPPY